MNIDSLSLDFNKLIDTVTIWVSTYSVKILAAVLIFLVGKWISGKISRLFRKILEKNNVDVTIVSFLERLVFYSMMTLVIISAAGKLGINTASFLTIIGAAGLAVGLALKDSLSNFASGVMLILFRPFKVGDFVKLSGVAGSVHGIDIFNTTLNTPDNQKVIVPNAKITSDVITNVTANDTRRVDLVIGIGYEDDIIKAKEVLARIISQEERVLKDSAIKIAVSELGSSSVNLVARSWVKTVDYWDVYFALTEKIKITFDDQGISFPFPQQDVHLYQEKR